MFAKCQLAVVLRRTAVLALLVGGVAAGPAHANLTSVAVSDAKVSGGVAVVTVTATVDQDTPRVAGTIILKQLLRAGLLARGSGSFEGFDLPAGVPVSLTVTVYPVPTGPNFQAGRAEFDASASSYVRYYYYDVYWYWAATSSLRTLGTVTLKKAP